MALPALAIPALLKIGEGLIDRFFPDPQAANAAKLELLKMQQTGELAQLAADSDLAKGQLAVNAAEAASGNWFASSWRPMVGHVCAGALAFTYILNPLFTWALALSGSTVTPPAIGIDDHLWELLFAMLGMAGWRSLDKIKGKA
jgi:hypothetical protein